MKSTQESGRAVTKWLQRVHHAPDDELTEQHRGLYRAYPLGVKPIDQKGWLDYFGMLAPRLYDDSAMLLKSTLIEIRGVPHRADKLESAKFVYDELRRAMLSVKDARCGGCYNTECDHFITSWFQLYVIGQLRMDLRRWRNKLQKDFVSDANKEMLLKEGMLYRFLWLRDLTLAFMHNISHFLQEPADRHSGKLMLSDGTSSHDFENIASIRFPVIKIGFQVDWLNTSGDTVKLTV